MIYKFLKAYEPVIDMIKDCMHHFEACILNENFPI